MLALDPHLAALSADAMKIMSVIAIAIAAYFTVLWIAAVVWTYRDIESRTPDRAVQVLATGLVATFSLPGLLLYIAVRPSEPLVETYNRQLEAEALLHELEKEHRCPQCRRSIQDGFLTCPHCRATLREACSQCERSLSKAWAICPYCGAERKPLAAAAGIAAAARQGGERAPSPVDGLRPPERRAPVARSAS